MKDGNCLRDHSEALPASQALLLHRRLLLLHLPALLLVDAQLQLGAPRPKNTVNTANTL